MTSPIELAALALANHDARQVDAPELATIEEFRLDSDRDEYLTRARIVLAEIRDAFDESGLVGGVRQMAEIEGSESATRASAIYDGVIDWFDAAMGEE